MTERITCFARRMVPVAILCCLAAGMAAGEQLVWQTPAPSTRSFYISPDASVVVADDAGTLRDYTPQGSVGWTLPLGSPVVGALVPLPGGGLVMTTQDKRIVGVSTSGSKAWEATLPDAALGPPDVSSGGVVTVAAGTKLLAFSPAGAPAWTFDDANPLTGSPASTPVGTAIGAKEGGVYLVDSAGKQVWHYAVSDSVAVRLTGTAAGTVSYTATDQQVVGLDAKGQQAWFINSDKAAPFHLGFETAINGILYVVTGGSKVQAIAPDGSIAWTYDAGATISSPLVGTSDGRLLFGTSDARIVAVNLSGQKQSELKTSSAPAAVGSGPNGRYYALLNGSAAPGVGTNGLLAAIDPADSSKPSWKPAGLNGRALLSLSRAAGSASMIAAATSSALAVSVDDGKNWRDETVKLEAGDTGLHDAAIGNDGSTYGTSQNFLVYGAPAASTADIVNRADGIGPVAVDPADPAHVVFASTTGPTLTEARENGKTATDTVTPAVLTSLLWAGDGTLYGGSKDGLFARRKGGDWSRMIEGRVAGLAATDDGKVVYAGGDNRILRSDDSGKTFHEVGSGQIVGTAFRIATTGTGDELVSGTAFSGDRLDASSVQGINVLRSLDGGITWSVTDRGLMTISPRGLVSTSSAFLLATDDGAWKLDFAGAPPQVVPGDLNGDGIVDVRDVTIALQIAVGLIKPTPQQLRAGDVYPVGAPDGKITIGDVTRLLRVAVHLEKF